MDRADQVGLGEVQDLRAVLLAPEIVERKVAALDLAAHRTVEQQHPLTGEGEEIGHRSAHPKRQGQDGRARPNGSRGGGHRPGAQELADRQRQLGPVQGVDMQGGEAFRREPAALLAPGVSVRFVEGS